MQDINTIKTTNELGLITEIKKNALKTSVEWQIPSSMAEYAGTINMTKLLEREQ